jgi:HK97 family phage prohead protease
VKRPPRNVELYREGAGGDHLQFDQQQPGGRSDTLGLVYGYALEWDGWASISEHGQNFLETFAPGSLDETIKARGSRIKMLFGHGHGAPGDLPIGDLTLKPDAKGLRYQAELFDTAFNRDLVQPLRAGLMGSSVRFNIVRDQYTARPPKSPRNQRGIPERRITEARLLEVSVVTWGAYPQATANMRSSTDAWMLQRLEDDPERFAELRNLTAARRPQPVHVGPRPRGYLEPVGPSGRYILD